jgi:uncharacterized protein (DUF58 family)
MRPSPLLLALSALVGWAFFLGVLSDRFELMVVALPLVVALLSARPVADASDLHATAQLSATEVVEGDEMILSTTIASRVAVPLVDFLPSLPLNFAPARGLNRSLFGVGAGEPIQRSFELRAVTRGRSTIGPLLLRISDRSGLQISEVRLGKGMEVRVHPRVPRVRRLPQPLRTRSSFGNYVAPRAGEGLEPAEIRPFQPGDRVRRVNWRASLRLGRLYVTQFHQERNADVVLLLDTYAETGARPNSSLDATISASIALASAYLSKKDRVGIVQLGGTLQWIRPGAGRRHFETLLDAVLPADAIFTYLARKLELVPPRVLPPNALVIAISPLIDDRFAKALIDLAGRGFDLLIIAISPIALTRAVLPQSDLTDLVCRLWALERQIRIDELRRSGLLVLEWSPEQPLEGVLASLERRRHMRGLAS